MAVFSPPFFSIEHLFHIFRNTVQVSSFLAFSLCWRPKQAWLSGGWVSHLFLVSDLTFSIMFRKKWTFFTVWFDVLVAKYLGMIVDLIIRFCVVYILHVICFLICSCKYGFCFDWLYDCSCACSFTSFAI